MSCCGSHKEVTCSIVDFSGAGVVCPETEDAPRVIRRDVTAIFVWVKEKILSSQEELGFSRELFIGAYKD